MDDERFGIEDLPELGRVRPRLRGRGLALPPLTAIAGVVGVILGLVVGMGLGGAHPARPPEVSMAPSAPPTVEAVPTAPGDFAVIVDPWPSAVGTPPPGGLPLDQALALLYSYDPTIHPGGVVSASVEESDAMGTSGEVRWRWVFTIRRADATRSCSDTETPESGRLSGSPTASNDTDVAYTYDANGVLICMPLQSEVVEIDYLTGEYLGTTGRAYFSQP
jgi:hypothetical protein